MTSSEPKIVYHYTSIEAACNILSSRTFWATNVMFQNDKSEMEIAYNLTKEVLEERLNEEKTEAEKRIININITRKIVFQFIQFLFLQKKMI